MSPTFTATLLCHRAAPYRDASSRLTSLQPQLTCDNMLQRATSEQGLLGSDLGESDVRNLAPQFQQVAATGAVGSVSGPVRTPLGLHLVGVCGRRLGGPQAPTYEQVERRMQTEGLSLLGRRYIRDLRADALIEMPPESKVTDFPTRPSTSPSPRPR